MWDLKKIPRKRWTWHFCFEIIKIGQHLLPLKVPHRNIEFGIDLCFFILFTYSYFWKIGQHLLPLKCVTATLNFELIYLNVFWLLFLLSINLIHIKHRHDISVLKSFNNSPACIYFHSKCLTARLSFELYLCFFIYSFIHSLIHIFFTIIYLFHFI